MLPAIAYPDPMHAIPASDRAVSINHNGGPPDDEIVVSLDAAKEVKRTAEFLAWLFENDPVLILATRGKPKARALRKLTAFCCRKRIKLEELAEILGMNRKTVGEDQKAVEEWAFRNDALEKRLEHISEAAYHVVSVNPDAAISEMLEEQEVDVALARLARECRAAEREAREAADRLAAKRRISNAPKAPAPEALQTLPPELREKVARLWKLEPASASNQAIIKSKP